MEQWTIKRENGFLNQPAKAKAEKTRLREKIKTE